MSRSFVNAKAKAKAKVKAKVKRATVQTYG